MLENIKQLVNKYQENYNNSVNETVVYQKDIIKVKDFNFNATKEQEVKLINDYKNSELKQYINFEIFVYNQVKQMATNRI